MVDWSTITWHENPKKLENIFSIDLDNDGEITTISSNSTTPIATDTNGARLRETSDGSLFIQDGDSTLKITGPDGGYIGFNVEEVWDNGSFKSEAIAVQKLDLSINSQLGIHLFIAQVLTFHIKSLLFHLLDKLIGTMLFLEQLLKSMKPNSIKI